MPALNMSHQRSAADLTHVDHAILAAKLHLRRLFTLISLLLECLLSNILFLYTLFFPDESLGRHLDYESDNTKGNALVIWAATHDQLARRFAIRLAAATPSSYAFLESGASMISAKTPYTCIVLLSEASQLPVLVAEWAAKKAEVEAQWQSTQHGRWASQPSPPYSPQVDRQFDLHRRADPSPQPPASPEARRGNSERTSRSEEPLSSSGLLSRTRSRSLLRTRWRDWIPSNVVGFGIDALKGWRIGQTAKPNIGSVIPIVADPSSPEGLAYAKSTVNAYCQLHNLVLRGIIVAPSILGPRYVSEAPSSPRSTFDTDPALQDSAQPTTPPARSDQLNRDLFGNPAEGSRAGLRFRSRSRRASRTPPPPLSLPNVNNTPPHSSMLDRSDRGNASEGESAYSDIGTPPMSPTTARASRRQDEELNTLRAAIKTDLGDAAALVNALFPALKQAHGRVLALIPSGFGVEMPDDVEFLERFGQRRDVVLAHCLSDASSSASSSPRNQSSSEPSRQEHKGKQTLQWPPSTRTTVREALETMWTSLIPEYALSGVSITLIQTPPLLATPLPPCPQPRERSLERRRRMLDRDRPRPWKYSISWWIYMLTERGRRKLNDEPPFEGWFGPPTYAPYLAPLQRERRAPLSEYPFFSEFPTRDKGTGVWALRKLVRLSMEVKRLMQPFDTIILPPAEPEPKGPDTTEDEAFLRRHSKEEWLGSRDMLQRLRDHRQAEAEERHHAWRNMMEERRKNDVLLFEVLRKALQDRPRRWYPVGLAARMDRTASMLPGVRGAKRWLKEVVDF
ncbi:hypothetical protein ACQY0O_004698 [Thecaphora frezii]